jgi:hypothetical protein
MLLVFFIFTYVLAARPECTTSNTVYYKSHCCPIKVNNFFYPSTSPINAGDRCATITNQELRNQYPWIKSTDQIEHIVDTSNGPDHLKLCNKNIRGNLIVAIGIWNNQVGQLCWKDVEGEKRSVYGNTIFDYTLESVRICCELSTISNDSVIFFLTFICISILTGAHVVCYCWVERYRELCQSLVDIFRSKEIENPVLPGADDALVESED